MSAAASKAPLHSSGEPKRAAASPVRARLARVWPQLRALLVALHLLAVVLLSLPQPHRVLDQRGWRSENARHDLEQWSARLSQLGFDYTPQTLARDLWDLSVAYVEVYKHLAEPFLIYARTLHLYQGWTMFATPQKHPAEFHVDIRQRGEWTPIYRPHSALYDFAGPTFRHNRLRKQFGRFARALHFGSYEGIAYYTARRAALAFPQADSIRVRLYRYQTLEPEAVRAGKIPEGRYDEQRLFDAAKLRAAAAAEAEAERAEAGR